MAPKRTPRTLLPSCEVSGDRLAAGADAELAVGAEQVAADGLLTDVEVERDRADGEPVDLRRAQRRPRRSTSAMTGRPVFDPRDRLAGQQQSKRR